MDASTASVTELVHRQRAFVRALRDEVERCDSSGPHAEALREQLREERMRLAALLADAAAG